MITEQVISRVSHKRASLLKDSLALFYAPYSRAESPFLLILHVDQKH